MRYDMCLDMAEHKIPPDKHSGRTDEELAELCRDGNEDAFKELMRRYLRPIYNFVYQYGKTVENAEDISQDAFFKVWKNIHRFTKGRQFRPWLYTIARNTALDHLKKKRAVSFTELDDPEENLQFADTLEDEGPLQAETLDTAIETARLTKSLEKLHPDHRAILMLHYREEMTFDEIAGIVGRPMNTVKSWHRRALLRLREIMVAPETGSPETT